MIFCAASFAAAAALAKAGETRDCKTIVGGQVFCGDLNVGITPAQYQEGLKNRADEIRAEEAKKRDELQALMTKQLELTERATAAEKESLRSQIATVEAQKHALEAESTGVADRLKNLQASYDLLVQKLAEANAALQDFAPLISKDAFQEAQAMLRRGDVLGAERRFVEIADIVSKLREKADVVEARAAFQAGQLAEQRIDWRVAYADYRRAAGLQPSNFSYAQKAASLADAMGDYPAAASFQDAALRLATSEFGPDADETAAGINNLAVTYERIARYAEAEQLFRQAIATGEKTSGKKHQTVAASYSNLASVLQAEGKYAEAEPFFRRAISIGEQALGQEHPDLATIYNNLAMLLQAQGKYVEAEPLFRQAIAIVEKSFGMEHPSVASGYNNFALLLQDQGKYAEAELLFRHAISIQEKILGNEHPMVASSYNNLAGVLREQGKFVEAEPLYRRAIAIGEKTLGKEHPDVITRYNNLAELLRVQGKFVEADPLYRQAIAVGEKVLGKDHPAVASAYGNLASLLQEQGKYAEAEPLYYQAIAINEKALGKEHPSVATECNNLAFLLQAQGKYAEAEPLYRRAIAIDEKTRGKEHPDTTKFRMNYYRLRQLMDAKSAPLGR